MRKELRGRRLLCRNASRGGADDGIAGKPAPTFEMHSPVGAGLLAKAVGQSPDVSTDTPHSRATRSHIYDRSHIQTVGSKPPCF